MLNIVLFGPPGAGKGTQAEKIIERFNLVHLSTGDILRAEIKAKTQLGIEAKKVIDNGNLVPDEVVVGMIRNKLEMHSDAKGFIFDGFPRTIAQAKALDKLLDEIDAPIRGMIALEVSNEELIKRLLNRGKDSGRSDDQDVSIIENRIKVYFELTAPLINYYREQQKQHSIHGIGSVDEIFQRITATIETI